jgi:hypothetical protein
MRGQSRTIPNLSVAGRWPIDLDLESDREVVPQVPAVAIEKKQPPENELPRSSSRRRAGAQQAAPSRHIGVLLNAFSPARWKATSGNMARCVSTSHLFVGSGSRTTTTPASLIARTFANKFPTAWPLAFPGAANIRLKALRGLFNWASENAAVGVKHNPTRDIGRLKVREMDIMRRQNKIVQRRSDIARFGRQHVHGGKLRFTQQKNRRQADHT